MNVSSTRLLVRQSRGSAEGRKGGLEVFAMWGRGKFSNSKMQKLFSFVSLSFLSPLVFQLCYSEQPSDFTFISYSSLDISFEDFVLIVNNRERQEG